VKAEVERIFQLQHEDNPQRRYVRVRITGDCLRRDQTVVKPGVEFRPDLSIDTVEILGGGNMIRYSHDVGTALIQPTSEKWPSYRRDFENWFVVPQGVRGLGMLLFGKAGAKKGEVVKDVEKIERFVAEGSPQFQIRVTPDDADPKCPRDRIDVRLIAQGSQAGFGLLCDRNDYSRVYEFVTYDDQGRLRSGIEFVRADDRLVPRTVRIDESIDDQGEVIKGKEITIAEAKLNPTLPDDIFQWTPPKGYIITDRRGAEPKVWREGGGAQEP
jgi:hypothetical protein